MPNRFKRIAALTLTLIVVFPLAIVAANWQLNRHHEREKLNSQISKSIASAPVSIDSEVELHDMIDKEYRKVSLAGGSIKDVTWWRKQSLDGIPGYIALVDYRMSDKNHVVLALGWSQQPKNILNANLDSVVARVRLIRNFETDPEDLPPNQTNTPASVLNNNDKVYLELVSPKINSLASLPLPQMTAGPHLGYVGQWILIAIFAVAVYVIAIRNLPKS